MRASILALLFAVLLGLSPRASAQPFTVASTQPADHAVNVPLSATLSFTFSERVANDGAPILVVLPAEFVDLGEPTRSADGLTLSFPATLQTDTRYVALLLGAESEAGTGLSRAEALNFTTGGTNGNVTVRGAISAEGGLMPDGAIVALATGDLATGDIQIVAADVVSGGGASLPYTLGPVPFGFYAAGAILVPLPIGSDTGFGYGLFGSADGTPTPILFPTNSANITLAPPPPFVAGDGLDDAQAAADDALGGSALLQEVGPAIVDDGGASPAWTYQFRSPSLGGDGVQIIRLGLFTLPVTTPPVEPVNCAELSFLGDSDAALSRAETQGGAAFRAAHPGETITVTMRLAPICDAEIWSVGYLASGGDTTTVDVIYGVQAGEDGPRASVRRLALTSANPNRGAIEARLTLDAPAEARIRVIDAQGRQVATLLDARLGAGEHGVRWTPGTDVPAGTFWIVAEADGQTEALSVTRVR